MRHCECMTSDATLCCRRATTTIGLEREDGVVLRTCASCGRHAWFRGDVELDRSALLAALRRAPQSSASAASSASSSSPSSSSRPPAAARRPRRTAPVSPVERAELQDLLRGFTVHGA